MADDLIKALQGIQELAAQGAYTPEIIEALKELEVSAVYLRKQLSELHRLALIQHRKRNFRPVLFLVSDISDHSASDL